ncbi:hypothetical protein Y032_0014g2376 [Ancylostoma ceylanicum]|nr:hypothetical protein Y032_0014g2376 [Ancylostoma ceylanicum]
MKDGSKRIAYAAQTHAFTVSEQPRVLLVENVHAILTSLHGKSTASGCVGLKVLHQHLLFDPEFLGLGLKSGGSRK